MHQLLVSLLLFATTLTAGTHPLVGTWTMKEKIGSKWFTDYITVKSVDSLGRVVAVDQYGSAVQGYVSGPTVFLADVNEDYYMDSYYFDYSTRKFSKHMGVFSYYYDFQSAWHTLTVTKSKTVKLIPEFTCRAEESARKAEAARCATETGR